MTTGGNAGLPDAEVAKVAQKAQKEDRIPENDFSRDIIGAAVEVQRVLGVGLLESAYAAALQIELKERGLVFATLFCVLCVISAASASGSPLSGVP